MPTISGSVESKSRDGKSIKVQGNWYSCFLPVIIANANVGDLITFEYTEKPSADGARVYKNIKGVPQINGGASSGPAVQQATSNAPQGVSTHRVEAKKGDIKIHTQRSIVRSHAVTAAIAICNANNSSTEFMVDTVLMIAKQIEMYTSGDGDASDPEDLPSETA